jgi:hypothetical protein
MFSSGGINRNTVWGRRPADMARTVAQPTQIEPISSQLMRVTNFTVIDALTWRYKYKVRRARVGNSTAYTPELVTTDTQEDDALSVSELSNASDYVSYGVLKTNIPQGFAPTAIPINTYVMCVPSRTLDGTFIWLIVNTQAIDGQCGSGLTADDDYGAFLLPTDLVFEGGELDAPEGDFDYGGITFDDFGQFYDPVNQNDQQTFAMPVTATTDYGTY